MNLASKSGAKMVFGLNIMHNRVNQSKEYPEGLWDPQNSRDMISYALSQHFEFYGFELGQYHNPCPKCGTQANCQLGVCPSAQDYLSSPCLLRTCSAIIVADPRWFFLVLQIQQPPPLPWFP